MDNWFLAFVDRGSSWEFIAFIGIFLYFVISFIKNKFSQFYKSNCRDIILTFLKIVKVLNCIFLVWLI